MNNKILSHLYLVFLLQHVIAIAQNIDEENEIFENDADENENPEETGPYLEGDINGVADDFANIVRNGIISASYRWPHGIIPYKIEGSFSTKELEIITHALNEYHTKTCIRFRKLTAGEKDYIALTNKPTGCWAGVGRIGGRQEVNLQSGKCFSNYGTTIHELMHILGFFHEQNRYERDAYVKIIKENIKPNMLVNFGKLPYATATGYGIAYDYASVMHYKSTSFSKNGKPTLQALQPIPVTSKLGQREGFSKGDLQKILAMYRCH